MGYKTNHCLTIDPPLTEREIITAMLGDEAWKGYEDWPIDELWSEVVGGAMEAPDENGVCSSYGTWKWDENSDMLRLSRAFPRTRFTLEVGDDISTAPEYVTYYFNGQHEMVVPRIHIPSSTLWDEEE